MNTNRVSLWLAAALAAAAPIGCGGGDGSADAGADTDTDTDADADAGADGGADTDADADSDSDADGGADGWMGCFDHNECRWVCQGDAACYDDCAAQLSAVGAANWGAVQACIDESCDGLDGAEFNECFSTNCADVWAICWEDHGLDPDYVEVGPYCNEVGQIAHDVFWFDADGAVHELAHDFYAGYPAILFVVSAAWCGPCAAEAATLPGLQETYGAENLAILQLLTEGTTTGSPITEAIVQDWQDSNMGGAALAGGSLGYAWTNYIPDPSSFTIPYSVVIDGATMEIKAMGNEIDTAAIDALMP